MASVTLNGIVYNSTAQVDYGYLSSTGGFFAILTSMIDELASSTSLAGLAPAAADRFIFAPTSTAFVSTDVATNKQIVYASQYFG